MMMVSPWDGGTRLYEMALDVRSAVHEVIASNVANEETPGYQARFLPFHKALESAMQGAFPLEPIRTDPRHLTLVGESDRMVQFAKPVKTGGGPDGNTVNLEKEMTRMGENTLLYMAVSQFLGGRFKGWRAAIMEGRQG